MRIFSNRRGPKPSHNATQLVRAHLGLTQQDLADLLRVSRVAVAMDERGERFLPWPSVERLRQLGQVLPVPDGPAPVPEVPPLVLLAEERETLLLRRQRLTLDAYPLQKELARVEVRLTQARLWQQALPALRAGFPLADTFAHQWLDYFVGRADATLRSDSGQPALLGLRLATLAFEITEIDRLLGAETAETAETG